MTGLKQKLIVALIVTLFAGVFTYLGFLVYSLEEERQDAYEKGMKEAKQLSTLNAMEQLRGAVNLYVIDNDKYPDILIDDLVNEGVLIEEAISLKDKFSINKNDLTINYEQDFDCDFMFKNLNDHVHLKVKNDILNCENKTLTFSIKGFK